MATRTTPLALLLASASALCAATLAPAARADDLPPFDRRGRVVFDDLLGFRFGEPGYFGQLRAISQSNIAPPPTVGQGGLFGYEHQEARLGMPQLGNDVATKSDSFWLTPELDYFVTRRLTVGIAAGYLTAKTTYRGTHVEKGLITGTAGITVTPRVGYVVPINDRLAFWPRLGFGFTATAENAVDPQPVISGASVVRTWAGGVELGVVYRVTQHLLVHLTPALVASDSYAVSSAGEFKNFAIGASGAASVALTL